MVSVAVQLLSSPGQESLKSQKKILLCLVYNLEIRKHEKPNLHKEGVCLFVTDSQLGPFLDAFLNFWLSFPIVSSTGFVSDHVCFPCLPGFHDTLTVLCALPGRIYGERWGWHPVPEWNATPSVGRFEEKCLSMGVTEMVLHGKDLEIQVAR